MTHNPMANERLIRAAASGDAAGLERAIADGADLDCESELERMTPLMLTAMNGESKCMALLLAHGADPCGWVEDSNQLHQGGFPNGLEIDALWFAANSGSKACVELLFDAHEGRIADFRLRACLSTCPASLRPWLTDFAHGGWESSALSKAVPEADSSPAPGPRL